MGGPPPSSSLGQCEVCEKEAKSRCAGCFQSFYCSKEHQVKAWPTHRATCAPIKVCQNDKVGRFYVATRDIKPGEIVLRENPLVVGPSQATPPVCVGCFKVNLLTFMRPHIYSCIRATRFICMQNIIVLSERMSWTAVESLIGNCAQPEVDLETDVDNDEHIFMLNDMMPRRRVAMRKKWKKRKEQKEEENVRWGVKSFNLETTKKRKRKKLVGKIREKVARTWPQARLKNVHRHRRRMLTIQHSSNRLTLRMIYLESAQVGRHITFFSYTFHFLIFPHLVVIRLSFLLIGSGKFRPIKSSSFC